ncbi:Glutamate-ammonia-ligase adenylyltransferase [Mucisphaera calidilacus]|uniref:Glutamate-ammonia-ligase adenylyltransferase n=2 Tax=Mucisphaera calidilacus TaxID=2527982 RepID=A0A518BUV1_9BACT|nr:Glutamate-ammonia-ligase adenylyltransferase [Mucisphaera calidilacus]
MTWTDEEEARRLWSVAERLPERYLQHTSDAGKLEDLRVLARLSRERPVEVFVQQVDDHDWSVAVYAIDRASEFAAIAGVLASMGFEVRGGQAYTLPGAAKPVASTSAPARMLRGLRSPRGFRRRVTPPRSGGALIIDRFRGHRTLVSDDASNEEAGHAWQVALRDRLIQTLEELHRCADDDAVRALADRVTESVLSVLSDQPTAVARAALLPIELDLKRVGDRRISLEVRASDTPAFLYTLATALAVRGLAIDSVEIRTDDSGEQVVDRFELSLPPSITEITDDLLDRIRVSALLIKQFGYRVDQTPEPIKALARFQDLLEDIFLRRNPALLKAWIELSEHDRAMRGLARLLGTSDRLWEECIRGQSERLIDILRAHRREQSVVGTQQSMPQRLEEALDRAIGIEQQRDRLNAFKDDELFRIDADYILDRKSDFSRLSERLTQLAEILVGRSAELVYEDMVASYGHPVSSVQQPAQSAMPGGLMCPARPRRGYAVFALGKLGGTAIGFGSDIELLYVHDQDPNATTAGGKRPGISCAEFYTQFTQEASAFIRARRDGIFEPDLRLRPYGNDGPLIPGVELFERYYGPGGPAHPFELLSLVRLRWIGGDPELGYRVQRLRNQFVYEQAERVLDLDALWSIWGQMKKQKLPNPQRINAKYSPGSLVDLEGALLILQVAHAEHVPQLRTARMSRAFEAMRLGGVLSPQAYADVRGGYSFLRRLINALRVVRGHAKDLFLPEPGSTELTHLARRTGYPLPTPEDPTPSGERLLQDFEYHTGRIRVFIEQTLGRRCPGIE